MSCWTPPPPARKHHHKLPVPPAVPSEPPARQLKNQSPFGGAGQPDGGAPTGGQGGNGR